MKNVAISTSEFCTSTLLIPFFIISQNFEVIYLVRNVDISRIIIEDYYFENNAHIWKLKYIAYT